jgi:hypothetical protein
MLQVLDDGLDGQVEDLVLRALNPGDSWSNRLILRIAG